MFKPKDYKTNDAMQAELEAFMSSARARLAYLRSSLTVHVETTTDKDTESKQRLDAVTDPVDQVQEQPLDLVSPQQTNHANEKDLIDVVQSETEAGWMSSSTRMNANANVMRNALMSDKEGDPRARLAAIKQRLAGKLNRE